MSQTLCSHKYLANAARVFGSVVLTEQPLDLSCDSGDDRIIENQRQGCQYNGNDDLHGIRDIEISTLVGDCQPGTVDEMVCFAADTICNFSHGKPPVKILMIYCCCMYLV